MSEPPPVDGGVDPLAAENRGSASMARRLVAGELLSASIRELTQHAIPYFVVAFACYLPGAWLSFSAARSASQSSGVGRVLLPAFLDAICTSVAFGILTRIAFDSLEGKPFAFGACFGAGLQKGFSVFALQFSLGILTIGSMLPGGILVAIGSALHGAAGALLMLVGGFGAVFGLTYVRLGYTFAIPILIDRDEWGSKALRESWSLAKSQRQPLFVAFLAPAVVVLVGASLSVVVLAIAGAWSRSSVTGGPELSPTFTNAIVEILTWVIQAFWFAASTVLSTLAYAQLSGNRHRIEIRAIADVFE